MFVWRTSIAVKVGIWCLVAILASPSKAQVADAGIDTCGQNQRDILDLQLLQIAESHGIAANKELDRSRVVRLGKCNYAIALLKSGKVVLAAPSGDRLCAVQLMGSTPAISMEVLESLVKQPQMAELVRLAVQNRSCSLQVVVGDKILIWTNLSAFGGRSVWLRDGELKFVNYTVISNLLDPSIPQFVSKFLFSGGTDKVEYAGDRGIIVQANANSTKFHALSTLGDGQSICTVLQATQRLNKIHPSLHRVFFETSSFRNDHEIRISIVSISTTRQNPFGFIFGCKGAGQ